MNFEIIDEEFKNSIFILPVALSVSVPYFDGSSSFLAYPTPTDSFAMTYLYLEVRPASSDGLLLLNSQLGGTDFIALALREGRVELWYDLGQGAVNITSTVTLALNEWHTIQVSRTRQDGELIVDGSPAVTGQSPGSFTFLQLSSDLYVGGAPMPSSLPAQLRTLSSYRGCVREVRVSRFVNSGLDLIADAVSGQGVTECPNLDLCTLNSCQNGGTCMNTLESFECECVAGFTGSQCETNICDLGNPCENNGVCFVTAEEPDLLQCSCSAPFTGDTCAESKFKVYKDVVVQMLLVLYKHSSYSYSYDHLLASGYCMIV